MNLQVLPRALPTLAVGIVLTLVGASPVSAKPGAAAPPSKSASMMGPLEAVAGLQSGLPVGAFGIAVLGTLGSDLYLFGSQAETTGAIQGVWRYRSGAWTRLGQPSVPLDFNRLAMYGAVEYRGSLYIGDRRQGNLYKLVLSPDGSFQDVVAVATIGNEDVLPGPVWNGQIILGTFGAYSTGDNPGLYTYDGVKATKRFDFNELGNAGFVTSIVPYGNDLWVTGLNASATLSQVWKFDKAFRASLQYSGVADYRLTTAGRDLFAVTSVYAFPYETHYLAKWQGSSFIQVSKEIGPFLMIGSIGAITLGTSVLDLCYYNGIYALEGTSVQQVAPGMPSMGAPVSVKEYDGYLWMATNQPVGLYRTRIGP